MQTKNVRQNRRKLSLGLWSCAWTKLTKVNLWTETGSLTSTSVLSIICFVNSMWHKLVSRILFFFMKNRYGEQSQDFVQVINICRNHWVCASNVNCSPGVVDLHDSLPACMTKAALTKLKEQLAVILHTSDQDFEIQLIDVQHQSGESDCIASLRLLFSPRFYVLG